MRARGCIRDMAFFFPSFNHSSPLGVNFAPLRQKPVFTHATRTDCRRNCTRHGHLLPSAIATRLHAARISPLSSCVAAATDSCFFLCRQSRLSGPLRASPQAKLCYPVNAEGLLARPDRRGFTQADLLPSFVIVVAFNFKRFPAVKDTP